ncbi:MAG TPA: hypothetical protein VFX58_14865 [Chitinophagaceae bacterium]|nr:hypothetical protein [Chitinophagaceae bacterium]
MPAGHPVHTNAYSMKLPGETFPGSARSLANPLLWTLFILYLILAGFTIAHHEMWGDEIHSWNIAKGSAGIVDLVRNSRYEGHPPAWYLILWSISKLSHDLVYVQLIHLVIAALSVFLVLFFSPLPLSSRIMIPFGYFFLFEYTVLSRNYAIGILLALCICIIIRKNFNYKLLLYYLLLFLLTNTHLQSILLAASLHVYFLVFTYEQNKRKDLIAAHVLLGILVALPALYFIFPPADSQLDTQFWMNRWSIQRLTAFGRGPLQAFLPIPAWWNYHSWNTQFLIEARNNYSVLRYINQLMVLTLLAMVFFILRKNQKSLLLFATNLALTLVIAIFVITLGAARHAGFLYIAFIAAWWLYCSETAAGNRTRWLVNILLVIQLIGGAYAVVKDIQHPFSNAYRVKELLSRIPPGEKAVTDYWTLNSIAAFADSSFYSIDLQKEISFVLWNKELGEALKKEHRYYEGVRHYFQKEGINRVYMLSLASPIAFSGIDPQLPKSFHVELVEKIEGAIEKAGNLYLYRISR